MFYNMLKITDVAEIEKWC